MQDPKTMLVEVSRTNDFYFDGVFIEKKDKNSIQELLSLGRYLKICPTCWRVSDQQVQEARQYLDSLREARERGQGITNG